MEGARPKRKVIKSLETYLTITELAPLESSRGDAEMLLINPVKFAVAPKSPLLARNFGAK